MSTLTLSIWQLSRNTKMMLSRAKTTTRSARARYASHYSCAARGFTNNSQKEGKAPAKKKPKLTIAKPKKAKKEKPFRFLDLPAELRDEIYELALTETDGIALCSRTKSYRRTVARGTIATQDSNYYYGRRSRRGYYYDRNSQKSQIVEPTRQLVPNVLAVNQQIRNEASSMLYKQEIILEDTTALHTFITQIGPYNRQLLSDITIKGWGRGRGVHKGHNFAALSMLSTCTNLQTLFIDCTMGWLRTPKQLARQLFRDGHYFFEAFGAANGRYDAAIDVLQFAEEWQFNKHAGGRWYNHSQDKEREADPEKKQQFEDELRGLLGRKK